MIDVTFHLVKKIKVKKLVGSGGRHYVKLDVIDRNGQSTEAWIFVDDPDALNVFNETEDEAE